MRLILRLMVVAMSLVSIAPSQAAVVLIYHRFGDGRFPSTNITLAQFDAHLEHLTRGDFQFMTASALVAAYREGRDVGDRTVVLTVDDAFRSVFDEAAPRLRAAGIPWSLFVSTDPVDDGQADYMGWADIRALRDQGVDIGHHGAGHINMLDEGREAAKADTERASKRFQTELGQVPDVFAYPYGEYSLEIRDLVAQSGFRGALAQYSSAADPAGDAYQIPRFPVNERYGDIDRFRLVTGVRVLPVRDIVPADPLLAATNNPPAYGFTVPGFDGDLSRFNCYPSHTGERAESRVLANKRVEIRFDRPFPPGRHRINCTMPAGDGRWYWVGRPFFRPAAGPAATSPAEPQ